jgi:hypothetical protein
LVLRIYLFLLQFFLLFNETYKLISYIMSKKLLFIMCNCKYVNNEHSQNVLIFFIAYVLKLLERSFCIDSSACSKQILKLNSLWVMPLSVVDILPADLSEERVTSIISTHLLLTEAGNFSEISVYIHKTARNHFTEYIYLQSLPFKHQIPQTFWDLK